MSELAIEFKTGPVELSQEDLIAMAGLYQVAFSKYPWYEVSRCVAPEIELFVCRGEFSPLEVGEKCMACGLCPQIEAYPASELLNPFHISVLLKQMSKQAKSTWA